MRAGDLIVLKCFHHFSFQLIFRKVADVEKEKLLAEQRKNDPVLNTTQDHLVRKLFSKFKKPSTGNLTSPGSAASSGLLGLPKDIERGTGGGGIQIQQGNSNNNTSGHPTNVNSIGSVSPGSASNTITAADAATQRKMSLDVGKLKPATGGGGGWARLMVSFFYFKECLG